ncbi:MAG: hypothetical protein IT538_10580 [Variibacter sp.]|nr:hypothetical protein [Variibacter sp.]
MAAAAFLALHSTAARAAGAAYQVDTSEVSDAGSCKVESWVSWASNRDFFAAASPSCAFNILKPVELSTQIARARADGDWTTSITPQAKMKLMDSGIGFFGLAISGNASFDLVTRQNTALAVTAPLTMRVSDVMRINLNAGWQWDRTIDRHYFTYGAGFDWRTPDNVWTLTGEVFGQLGATDTRSVVYPRFQTGIRYRPIDRFSIDLIYGRNITGEDAHWITLATIVRFPAGEK